MICKNARRARLLRAFALLTLSLTALLTSGAKAATVAQNSAGLVVLEAEQASLQNGQNSWRVASDSQASGGRYLVSNSSNWQRSQSGVATYRFSISRSGTALIYLRKRGQGRSVWISVDGKTISGPVSTEAVYTDGGGWLWADGYTATKLQLSSGEHTLQLRTRDADLRIDKIVIAPLNDTTIKVGSGAMGPTSEPTGTTTTEPTTSTPTPSGSADGTLVLEAESGRAIGGTGTWQRLTALNGASGGAYMRNRTHSWRKSDSASLNYSFSTSKSGEVMVYLRKAGTGGSVWLSVNGRSLSAIQSTQALYTPAGGWQMSNGFGAARVQLSAGSHTLQIHARSADFALDQIVISPVGNTPVTAAPTSSEPQPSSPTPSGTESGGAAKVTDFSRFSGDTNHSRAVTLPACDANAVHISTPSDLRLLESSNARVFCIAPGDYRSEGLKGPITIRGKHGSASAPKVIQLHSSLGVNDVIFDLSQSRLALLPSLRFENSSHWLVDRMAFIDINKHAPKGHIAVEMHASPNIVLNRLRMEGNNRSVNFFHGSHNSVLQNSLIGHSANLLPDNVCISLMGGLKFVGRESNYNMPSNGASQIYNIGIYNNEIVNCNDGIMFFWDPREFSRESYIYNNSSYWSDYQGAKIAGNDIYINTSLRTNCYGGASSGGLCANAENAIDIKAGSKNPANPVQIKDNRMWGFRKADGAALSDHGAAVSLHFIAAQNIELQNNAIWDSGSGIAMTRGTRSITVHNNLLHGIYNDGGRRPIYGNTGISLSAGGSEAFFGLSYDIEFSHNHVINSGGPWALLDSVQNAELECNVVLGSDAGTSWFNTRANRNSRIGKNSLYGGVRGYNLEGSGSVVRGSQSDARMTQACFTVARASRKGGQRTCLSNALSTRSSPHACDSSIWRNY